MRKWRSLPHFVRDFPSVSVERFWKLYESLMFAHIKPDNDLSRTVALHHLESRRRITAITLPSPKSAALFGVAHDHTLVVQRTISVGRRSPAADRRRVR